VVRIARDHVLRVARVRGERVVQAYELRTGRRFGEVALASPRGSEIVVVVRVAGDEPRASDAFQVLELRGGRLAVTFAVGSRAFADVLPLDEFRLTPEGDALLHLRTLPSGARVVRYELGGDR
jgi:hypothetical protein